MKLMVLLFRIVGFLEGISYLVLLGIAMPLKYLADMPLAVTIVGGMHGGLFVAYIGMSILLAILFRWPIGRLSLAVLASVVPTGTFWFDRHLHTVNISKDRSA
jgi:integral membrane protein